MKYNNEEVVTKHINKLIEQRTQSITSALNIIDQKNIVGNQSQILFIEKELLDICLIESIEDQITNKLITTRRENSKFGIFHNTFIGDMRYILKFLREIIILIKD